MCVNTTFYIFLPTSQTKWRNKHGFCLSAAQTGTNQITSEAPPCANLMNFLLKSWALHLETLHNMLIKHVLGFGSRCWFMHRCVNASSPSLCLLSFYWLICLWVEGLGQGSALSGSRVPLHPSLGGGGLSSLRPRPEGSPGPWLLPTHREPDMGLFSLFWDNPLLSAAACPHSSNGFMQWLTFTVSLLFILGGSDSLVKTVE